MHHCDLRSLPAVADVANDAPDDGGKDVFVSLRTLERSGINGLQPEQRVRVETRMGQKGPMAESIELI